MKEGGTLSIMSSIIQDKKNNKPYIKISIQDTGSGISKKDINSIYDPFYTTKYEGTGLGLSISLKNIQQFGGFFDVNSSEKGTVFDILIPLKNPQIEIKN